MRRWLRCLVCLVLVLVLLVQVSPIQARAVSSWIWVPAGIAIGYALLGLGAGAAVESQQNVISDLATDAYNWLTLNYSYYTDDDRIRIWSTSNPDMPYAIDEGLLEALFGWMWDTEVVSSKSILSNECSVVIGGNTRLYKSDSPFSALHLHYILADNTTSCSCYIFTQDSGATYSFWENGSYQGWDSFNISVNGFNCRFLAGTGSTHTVKCNGDYGTDYFVEGSGFANRDEALAALFAAALSGSVTTSKDLTLGEVAPAGSTIPEGYSIWNENAMLITDDDGTQRYVYPITLTDAYEDSLSITQADVWAGVGSTYVDSNTDVDTGDDTVTVPDTVTLSDILTGILSVPKSIAEAISTFFADVVAAVQAIPAAIADIFSVKGEVGSFTISLSDYFPFCIPFDLYDFLSCLNADPVAPVIDWEIPLPGGSAYPMQVDLSAWDDVAQLLRRLQLLLFCVGLAFKTRDLIKG